MCVYEPDSINVPLGVDDCNTEAVHNVKGLQQESTKRMSRNWACLIPAVSPSLLSVPESGFTQSYPISQTESSGETHPVQPTAPSGEGAVIRPISGLIAWAVALTLAQMSDPNIYLTSMM